MSEYWSVGLHGLTETDAEKVVAYAASLGYEGLSLSPRDYLSRSFDRSSVAMLAAAAKVGLEHPDANWDDSTVWGIQSMVEEMDEWLSEQAGGRED